MIKISLKFLHNMLNSTIITESKLKSNSVKAFKTYLLFSDY